VLSLVVTDYLSDYVFLRNFILINHIKIMAGPGGYRPGAGRKSRAEEKGIQKIAIKAIEDYYGSLEEGFKALLASEHHNLIRFVFEHAAGKPREKIDMDVEGEVQTLQIIRLPDNGRDDMPSIDIDKINPSDN
jgi:hypothetical protein